MKLKGAGPIHPNGRRSRLDGRILVPHVVVHQPAGGDQGFKHLLYRPPTSGGAELGSLSSFGPRDKPVGFGDCVLYFFVG